MSSNKNENQIVQFLIDNIFIPEYRQAIYLEDDLKDLIQIQSVRGHALLATGFYKFYYFLINHISGKFCFGHIRLHQLG